jgi:hypothetical protein
MPIDPAPEWLVADYPDVAESAGKADTGCPACRQIRNAAERSKPRPDDPRSTD